MVSIVFWRFFTRDFNFDDLRCVKVTGLARNQAYEVLVEEAANWAPRRYHSLVDLMLHTYMYIGNIIYIYIRKIG